MARMTAARAAVEILKREGVTDAFGVPGAAINPFYAALKASGGIHHTLARHVEGASHMAEGYTRTQAGNIGVCIGTSGPAGTAQLRLRPLGLATTGRALHGDPRLLPHLVGDGRGRAVPVQRWADRRAALARVRRRRVEVLAPADRTAHRHALGHGLIVLQGVPGCPPLDGLHPPTYITSR